LSITPQNTQALAIMAALLGTDTDTFLNNIIFWHVTREIEYRGIEYLAETLHAWAFDTEKAASEAAAKFEEVAVAAHLENKVKFLYTAEVRKHAQKECWCVHVEYTHWGGEWRPVLS
jgi:hypothetical protein